MIRRYKSAMTRHNPKNSRWQPLDEEILDDIDDLFAEIFPEPDYGRLAEDIADYWIERLEHVWANKPDNTKQRDLAYRPDDPLSRISPKTVVIAYPDSVQTDSVQTDSANNDDEPTLETLERFLDRHFPSVSGLHILPACRIVADRFNDGYFSQVKRDDIHERFGTNETFSRMVEKYFSMADFVLNHVDIENPTFRAFLNGDDEAGNCFYVFSERRYQQLKTSGAFNTVFRPRPFPLFTIFRRKPADDIFREMDAEQRCGAVNDILAPDFLEPVIIELFSVFEKIQNDQVLLDDDYAQITGFRGYLEKNGIPLENLFRLSQIQESTNPPYIFKKEIETRADLLEAIGYPTEAAQRIARVCEYYDHSVFGEQVRVMTTFSHVQVDVNTSTFEGMKMLADDFSWYLGLDINMLRLDAANYAFKKFHTSCFGLPEVKKLMQIMHLSMDCVSPRIVANLEVNDRLSVVLSQMADGDAAPSMMYDFHLPCMLPVVFNTNDARILDRIFELVKRYDLPRQSIRFSLAESHDGKSVRGSMDLLRHSERYGLTETILANGGRIKYTSVPVGKCSVREFREICEESGIDFSDAAARLFEKTPETPADELVLKRGIEKTGDILDALGIDPGAAGKNGAILFFADKVLNGREPYELCCATIDSMVRLNDEKLAAKRFLGFYTLAFALMGRNVKSIYFNDLPGLPNDSGRMKKTGEYRDIKRTKAGFTQLANQISGETGMRAAIARGIKALIELVDNDQSLHPGGNEAETIFSGNPAVAVVHNHCHTSRSLAIVNTSPEKQDINADIAAAITSAPDSWTDRLEQGTFRLSGGILSTTLSPYGRLWLVPSAGASAYGASA